MNLVRSVQVIAPPPPAAPGRAAGPVAHLAVSRSAAVRLGPVSAAAARLGVAHSVLDGAGVPPADVGAAVAAHLRETTAAVALIAGDGEAALAAGLAAAGAGVPIARVGAGLRCGDRGAPGELNRLVLDELAARLYVDGGAAADQLAAEGFGPDGVCCVGSTLSDAVDRHLAPERPEPLHDPGFAPGEYVLAAFGDPDVLADALRLGRLVEALAGLATRCRVVLAVDAATRPRLERLGGLVRLTAAGVRVAGPLSYAAFLGLQARAGAVVTDSAGVQEETSILGVPCFTLADASERTLTLTHGTNVLLGGEPEALAGVSDEAAIGPAAGIAFWDGRAGERIAADLAVWAAA